MTTDDELLELEIRLEIEAELDRELWRRRRNPNPFPIFTFRGSGALRDLEGWAIEAVGAFLLDVVNTVDALFGWLTPKRRDR